MPYIKTLSICYNVAIYLLVVNWFRHFSVLRYLEFMQSGAVAQFSSKYAIRFNTVCANDLEGSEDAFTLLS